MNQKGEAIIAILAFLSITTLIALDVDKKELEAKEEAIALELELEAMEGDEES